MFHGSAVKRDKSILSNSSLRVNRRETVANRFSIIRNIRFLFLSGPPDRMSAMKKQTSEQYRAADDLATSSQPRSAP